MDARWGFDQLNLSEEGKVRSDGGWASWSQEVTVECGEGKQKEDEEIIFCVLLLDRSRESDIEMHSSVFFGTHPTQSPPAFSHILKNNTTTRMFFTGNRKPGRCYGLGRAVCGGACK